MARYYYKCVELNTSEPQLITEIQKYAESNKIQTFILSAPLGDQDYSYDFNKGFVILMNKQKITVVNCSDNDDGDFNSYFEDIQDDIQYLAKKYNHIGLIGKKRNWKEYFCTINSDSSIEDFLKRSELVSNSHKRIIDIITSLFIGSINDSSKITAIEPESLLDKVKHKIQLFDTDQTKFIYDSIEGRKTIRIQGLSGTGKTELLLHRMKDLYLKDKISKIGFTCHNKVLASELKTRIPKFFNFMKVDQQIAWNERLWCVNAWGSWYDENSGILRYICNFYNVTFYNYRDIGDFDKVCRLTIRSINEKFKDGKIESAFTYLFIDECQDFKDSFFELCELVTERTVFIAGDTFQSIFEVESPKVNVDYQLSRCYRTDPRTLMFAHGLGLGLFEAQKLSWMDDDGWRSCGYKIEYIDGKSKLRLTREPIRRFEDIDDDFDSIKIRQTPNLERGVMDILERIIEENPSVDPDDIAIIFIDNEDYVYKMAPLLSAMINQKYNWECNISHETKEVKKKQLLISNRNNVKGLEFSFVICITAKITRQHWYRNALYTMLSRSFLKSYLLILQSDDNGWTNEMMSGWNGIKANKYMEVTIPNSTEIAEIKKEFQQNEIQTSPLEMFDSICNEFDIKSDVRKILWNLIEATKPDPNKSYKYLYNFISSYQSSK